MSNTAGSDDENEAGDDVAVDYRLLAKLTKKKDKDGQIVIPKRGEKDFEPLEKGANVQERALRDGREAMFGALEGVRGGNFKTISHAWLQQPLAAASPATSTLTPSLPVVLLMRGTHFTTLSHTLRTPPSAADAAAGLPPKPSTVLLPEEALHLLSRGSLALYSSAAPPPALDVSPQASLVEHQLLAPELAARKLTVQEATALWASEVSGGRWEVYVGLKRMGYVVQRAPRHLPKELRPAPDVGRAARAQAEQARRSWPGAAWAGLTGVFGRLWSAWTGVLSRFSGLLAGAFRRGSRAPAPVLPSYGAVDDEWTTLLSQRSVLPDEEWSYTRIFSRLRIIPNSSSPAPSPKPTPSPAPTADNEPAGPYDIFFHVWKPSSAYKKSNPPPPDFYVSVVEARTSPLPTIDDLLAILDQTPELPEPAARGAPTASPSSPPASSPALARSWRSLVPFLSSSSRAPAVNEENVAPRGAGRNPMPYLKQGDKNVVIAVVKDGGVSWMRFGRGVFGQMAIQ